VTAQRHTIPALIARWAEEQPDARFLVADDAVLTYGDLDRLTRDIGARLAARGVGKGTRVGVMMPNRAAWAVAGLAVARVGGVIVTLSTLLRPPELEAQLRTAAVEHLVVIPEFRGRRYLDDLQEISPALVPQSATDVGPILDPRLPRLRSVIVWPEWSVAPTVPLAPAAVVDGLAAAVSPADDLAIIFTSGSRGAPKGVIHTHGGALGNTEAGLEPRCIGRDEVLYVPMPFFWVGGFGTGLLSVLLAGATLVIEAQSDPERTLALLARERVTLFRGWPDQAATIAAHPSFAATDLSALRPGSLQAILPGGVPASRRAALLGMTESFGPYCGDRLDEDLPAGKEGSCGRPFRDVEVRTVDPDTGVDVASGEVGELHLRGPNLLRGICGKERSEIFTADGWFPTGDLAVIDADGYVFFRGRRDDMFKVKGASVYPSEVEAALRSLPEIQRVFVVDVEDSGAAAGSRSVGAVVVLAPGVECTDAELTAGAKARLSSFKVPTRWRAVTDDDVPMLSTGKVSLPGLRALLGDD
jgi:acyl-CoA synthetase (AMP-forming)/AMP-acid ligase II